MRLYVGSAGAADRHTGVANNMPNSVTPDRLHFRQAIATDVDVLVQFNQALAKVGQQRLLSNEPSGRLLRIETSVAVVIHQS